MVVAPGYCAEAYCDAILPVGPNRGPDVAIPADLNGFDVLPEFRTESFVGHDVLPRLEGVWTWEHRKRTLLPLTWLSLSSGLARLGSTSMLIEGVDPRDTEWEVDHPVYRVYFWHQPPAPPDIPQEQMGFHCTEYRLSDATDVAEVLDWARTTSRPEQTFTVYVEHHLGDRPGLIHLMGDDPTATP